MDLKGAITLEYPQNSGFIVIRLIVTPHLNFSSSLELCSLCSQRTPHHNFRKCRGALARVAVASWTQPLRCARAVVVASRTAAAINRIFFMEISSRKVES